MNLYVLVCCCVADVWCMLNFSLGSQLVLHDQDEDIYVLHNREVGSAIAKDFQVVHHDRMDLDHDFIGQLMS